MVTLVETIDWMSSNSDVLIRQSIEHLSIALTALVIGIVLWVPIGILIRNNERVSQVLLGASGIVLTIPSLALLPLLIPFFGIGEAPAIVALVLYSALPIMRNTVVGIAGIDDAIREAGRGLGLTDRQLLVRVQLPMAYPVIMAGIRQATVLLIAITTVAAYFGAGGLGRSIFAGIRLANADQIIGATIVLSALAIVLDYGLAATVKLLPNSEVIDT
ncbi:ABC transporter permease [Natrarchaeobius halalkaliphilus]|uniref:ABC transporter permease n=1 Tax=Natrarchaeobius halalkaliphilus TaxID=1679091 RepID=A0A3N6LIE8_9EURY|nr:ABC transporter permease [Natrarchaeobius halalkaliphilus]RQG86949.1 ABC transporter permease [Natrarchaeobius halalkaliphilus]